MSPLVWILAAAALVAGLGWLLLAGGSLAEPGRRGLAAYAVGAVALLAAAGVVAAVIANVRADSDAKGAHGPVALSAAERHGGQLFRRTCGSCHTLAAARTAGDVGPDLDLIDPPPERTLRVIEHGSIGYTAVMPPGLLAHQDARDVAAYLAKVARR